MLSISLSSPVFFAHPPAPTWLYPDRYIDDQGRIPPTMTSIEENNRKLEKLSTTIPQVVVKNSASGQSHRFQLFGPNKDRLHIPYLANAFGGYFLPKKHVTGNTMPFTNSTIYFGNDNHILEEWAPPSTAIPFDQFHSLSLQTFQDGDHIEINIREPQLENSQQILAPRLNNSDLVSQGNTDWIHSYMAGIQDQDGSNLQPVNVVQGFKFKAATPEDYREYHFCIDHIWKLENPFLKYLYPNLANPEEARASLTQFPIERKAAYISRMEKLLETVGSKWSKSLKKSLPKELSTIFTQKFNPKLYTSPLHQLVTTKPQLIEQIERDNPEKFKLLLEDHMKNSSKNIGEFLANFFPTKPGTKSPLMEPFTYGDVLQQSYLDDIVSPIGTIVREEFPIFDPYAPPRTIVYSSTYGISEQDIAPGMALSWGSGVLNPISIKPFEWGEVIPYGFTVHPDLDQTINEKGYHISLGDKNGSFHGSLSALVSCIEKNFSELKHSPQSESPTSSIDAIDHPFLQIQYPDLSIEGHAFQDLQIHDQRFNKLNSLYLHPLKLPTDYL